MSENPERIWAEQPDIFDGMGIWHGAGDGPGAEYIRLDVHESAVAAARAHMADVYWRLRSYAYHDNDCKRNKPPYTTASCSCGLTAALVKGEAACGAEASK